MADELLQTPSEVVEGKHYVVQMERGNPSVPDLQQSPLCGWLTFTMDAAR